MSLCIIMSFRSGVLHLSPCLFGRSRRQKKCGSTCVSPFSTHRDYFKGCSMRKSYLALTILSVLSAILWPNLYREDKVFDYVIVGGGAAGSLMASRLSEDPSKTVLVLHRGTDDVISYYRSSPLILYRCVSHATRRLPLTQHISMVVFTLATVLTTLHLLSFSLVGTSERSGQTYPEEELAYMAQSTFQPLKT